MTDRNMQNNCVIPSTRVPFQPPKTTDLKISSKYSGGETKFDCKPPLAHLLPPLKHVAGVVPVQLAVVDQGFLSTGCPPSCPPPLPLAAVWRCFHPPPRWPPASLCPRSSWSAAGSPPLSPGLSDRSASKGSSTLAQRVVSKCCKRRLDGIIVEMKAKMAVTSRTPSTLVVRKMDILAGFHAPLVSRAAEGYTAHCLHHPHGVRHLCPHDGGFLRSSHQILAVLSPESIRSQMFDQSLTYCQEILWLKLVSIHGCHLKITVENSSSGKNQVASLTEDKAAQHES